jgi:CheY-like chemotaxis protein
MTPLHTVLLIDDNHADNYFHRTLIEESGLAKEVKEFHLAEQALEFLREGSISGASLIFLDINMPRMNGFEFLEAFGNLNLATENETNIIVMLTASLNPLDEAKAATIPQVARFINKPLNPSLLLEIVKTHFSF